MQDVYVARQPIFDKNKHIYAYELLFRDGTANHLPDIDGDVATTSLLANTFFTIGMDALAGGRKSFINFTQNLLEKKVPLLLPKETTVIEILEDVKPGPALIDACAQMAASGYTLALCVFRRIVTTHSAANCPPIPLHCDHSFRNIVTTHSAAL